MLRIGLTGGIGSGKTTIASLFRKLNVPVITCDEITHQLLSKSTIKQAIIDHFGPEVLKNNTIDRKALRSIVFENIEHRTWLENLLQPLIKEEMVKQIAMLQAAYVIIEIPLLIEAHWEKEVDRILVVESSRALQIERVKQRDQSPQKLIEKIIDKQATTVQRKMAAHDIIVNTEDLLSLKEQIEILHHKYMSYSDKK